MRSPLSLHFRLLLSWCVILAAAVACSTAESSGDTLLGVEVSQDEITVENRTGTPLTRGEISVVPYGTVPRPYVLILPRLSIGEKRSFPLSAFRNEDGTRFMRGAAKGRRVKITARDVGGRTYEREVPFR